MIGTAYCPWLHGLYGGSVDFLALSDLIFILDGLMEKGVILEGEGLFSGLKDLTEDREIGWRWRRSGDKMLSLAECIRWTGITLFEIWLHSIGLLLFSVLVVVKIELYPSLTFWHVFTPLFVVTALNFYFLFIVVIRAMVERKECKEPIMKYALSWLRLIMIGIFEALLCYKVNGDLEDGQVAVQSSYGVIFLPIWVLMAALCFQACRLL